MKTQKTVRTIPKVSRQPKTCPDSFWIVQIVFGLSEQFFNCPDSFLIVRCTAMWDKSFETLWLSLSLSLDLPSFEKVWVEWVRIFKTVLLQQVDFTCLPWTNPRDDRFYDQKILCVYIRARWDPPQITKSEKLDRSIWILTGNLILRPVSIEIFLIWGLLQM